MQDNVTTDSIFVIRGAAFDRLQPTLEAQPGYTFIESKRKGRGHRVSMTLTDEARTAVYDECKAILASKDYTAALAIAIRHTIEVLA